MKKPRPKPELRFLMLGDAGAVATGLLAKYQLDPDHTTFLLAFGDAGGEQYFREVYCPEEPAPTIALFLARYCQQGASDARMRYWIGNGRVEASRVDDWIHTLRTEVFHQERADALRQQLKTATTDGGRATVMESLAYYEEKLLPRARKEADAVRGQISRAYLEGDADQLRRDANSLELLARPYLAGNQGCKDARRFNAVLAQFAHIVTNHRRLPIKAGLREFLDEWIETNEGKIAVISEQHFSEVLGKLGLGGLPERRPQKGS